ncbi:MAG: hypothetical protein H0W83_13235, partial [Planctomycetes bacterium]|nr:hypothetical protein [Planctomycetota bacterium]
MVGTAAPGARRLRAGPWDLELVDGDLRGVRIDGREAVQRIYLAVRDAEWGTVPARVVRQHVEANVDSFRIELEIESRGPEIHVRWRVDVSGSADGTIAYAIDGVAGTAFSSARMGLCVLLSRTLAGVPYRVHHVDGSDAFGALPLLVAPQQPVQDIGGFAYGLAADTEASLRFAGETFEMEDQRNWGDASFKIYGTPLARPYPVAVAAGARIRQSVELRSQRRQLAVAVAAPPASPPARLPKIGIALPAEALDADAQVRLRALRPDHLRIDVDLRTE